MALFMKKIILLFLVVLIGFNNKASAQEPAIESNIVPGNLLVMLNCEHDAKQLTQELSSIGHFKTDLKIGGVLSSSMHIYLLEFNPTLINPYQLLAAVRNNPRVKIAQFNHTVQERATTNDPQFSALWNMNNTGQSGGTVDADIDAPEAWNITTGGLTSQGDTIVVAVIDRGFELNQEDINFWKNNKEIPNNNIDDDNNGYIDDVDGWNSYTKTDNWTSADHGTHVSGIVGAKGNNGIGVTGVNWNVKVMPVSYGNSSSFLFEANVVAAYTYVRDQRKLYNQTIGAKGAFVVATNSSFGVDLGLAANYPLWCAMYDSLGAVGILNAGATTNSNTNVDIKGDMPSTCTSNWLISVTSTTRTDTKATAGYGINFIDLGAPGSNIISTVTALSGNYKSISGTSMATPHVAGAIALMYSVPCNRLIENYKNNPAGVALIVKDSLLKTTDKISALNGITVTGGRLNLFGTVNSMMNYCKCDPASNKFISDAGIAITVPKNSYASTNTSLSPEIILYNYGKDTLKSCNVIYGIDGSTLQTYNWVGKLAPCQFEAVNLNSSSTLNMGSHVFKVYTDGPNNVIDNNTFNDTATSNFTITHVYAEDFNSSLNIYPVPNNGNFTVSCNLKQTENLIVKVINVLGEIVFSKLLENVSIGNHEIDTAITSSGIYFVEISGETDKTIKKISIVK